MFPDAAKAIEMKQQLLSDSAVMFHIFTINRSTRWLVSAAASTLQQSKHTDTPHQVLTWEQ